MAKFFQSANELCDIYQALFKKLLRDSSVGKTVVDLKMNLRFIFTDPKAEINIQVDENKWHVLSGETDQKAEITFWMSSDSAHRLWLGQVTPLSAIMSREIRATGPIRALNEIAAVFGSSRQTYFEILQKHGRADLLPNS